MLTGCVAFQDKLFDSYTSIRCCFAGLQEKRISTKTYDWAYLEGGEPGQPVMVILHGATSDKYSGIDFAGELDGYHVLLPDLPGYGDTGGFDPAQSYSIQKQSERLSDFLNALNLTEVHLLGVSMGGAVSAHYASTHPERIRKLILFAAGWPSSPEPSEAQKLLMKGDNIFIVTNQDEFNRLFDLAFEEPPFLPWPSSNVLTRKAIKQTAFFEKVFADNAPSPDTDKRIISLLSQIEAPTLIVWGDHDRFSHVSGASVLNKAIPDSKVVILENVGHVATIEVPEAVAKLAMDFLAE